MTQCWVSLKERSYPILIDQHATRILPSVLQDLGLRGYILSLITTAIVQRLHGQKLRATLRRHGWRCETIVVPDAESSKSVRSYVRLVDRLILQHPQGQPALIAFGGGVVGDLVGFTAATWKRGIPYLQVPTTLLAQVDSAIGGKTALDLPTGKNLIGAFYQPCAVVSDTDMLRTLPVTELRSGLAEVVKYGLLGDPLLLRYLEHHSDALLAADPSALAWVVARCSRAKARLVALDEYDRSGVRMRLNLGHTIGHAIEAAAGYGRRYRHGYAIAIGMVGASRLAERLGVCGRAVVPRLMALLERIGLPTACPDIRPDCILEAMRHDKKFLAGENRFVLPVRIGAVRIVRNVPPRLIRDVVYALAQAPPTRPRPRA